MTLSFHAWHWHRSLQNCFLLTKQGIWFAGIWKQKETWLRHGKTTINVNFVTSLFSGTWKLCGTERPSVYGDIIVEHVASRCARIVAIILRFSQPWVLRSRRAYVKHAIKKCRRTRNSSSKWTVHLSILVFSLTPLAVQCELRQGVIDMHFDPNSARLATVGYDRAIMVWNVSSLLQWF